jgi:protein-disulfide isomerase
MRIKLDQVASIAIIIAAGVVAYATVSRRARGTNARAAVASVGPPTYVSGWESMTLAGRRVGDEHAPITIAVFSDLECPFCRKFHQRYRSLPSPLRDSVALLFVHFPLSTHRFASRAARSAECAAHQGRFAQFIDVVYDQQDSLGLRSWEQFATTAGVTDVEAFRRCAADTVAVPSIDSGVRSGMQLGVTGTPTVLINGWRYPAPPYVDLPSAVRESYRREQGRSTSR